MSTRKLLLATAMSLVAALVPAVASAEGCPNETDCFINNQCIAQGEPCDDGNPCTGSSVCQNKACVGRDVKQCGDPCAGNHCDPATGNCVVDANVSDGVACDDTDPCTEGDRCIKAQDTVSHCVGLPVICKVDECWVGHCDATVPGCVKEMAPDGTACDNGTCHGGACQREDALRSYSCGTTGGSASGPLSIVLLVLAALVLMPRRAAHR